MKHYIAAAVLIFFASIKVGADILDLPRLGAAAAVTNMAPAMKVFTAHRGYETFSSAFVLQLRFEDGEIVETRLAPNNYSGLQGPYNRRNVYGALIAYGPVLVSNPATLPMWQEMSYKTFCRDGKVISELGIEQDKALSSATIHYIGQVKKVTGYAEKLEVSCE